MRRVGGVYVTIPSRLCGITGMKNGVSTFDNRGVRGDVIGVAPNNRACRESVRVQLQSI